MMMMMLMDVFFYQKKNFQVSYGPALVTTTIDTFIKHYQEIYCLSRELPIKLVSLGAKKKWNFNE